MSINSSSPSQQKTSFQCPHYAQSEIFTTAGMEFDNRVSNFVRTNFAIAKQAVSERANVVKAKMPAYQQTAKEALVNIKQKACDLRTSVRTSFADAKQAASERANVVKAQMPAYQQTAKDALADIKQKACDLRTIAREKLPLYQEKVQKQARQIWDKIPAPKQRYAKLVFSRDAGEVAGIKYKPNVLEELGNWILYPSVDLPKKLPTYKDNPIVVGLVSTKVAMFTLKLLAYPKKTVVNMIGNIRYLPRLTYLFAQLSLIGLGCRSVGRMINQDLMEAFNAPEIKQGVKQEVKQEQKADDSLLRPLEPVKAQSKEDFSRYVNCDITPQENPRYRRMQ